MPTYHGLARSSPPATTRTACEDHTTHPNAPANSARAQRWKAGSKGSSGLAQACLCHRLLIQQLPPRNCHSALSRSVPGGLERVWAFLQPSAAPPIVLNGGGRECGGYAARLRSGLCDEQACTTASREQARRSVLPGKPGEPYCSSNNKTTVGLAKQGS